MSRLREKMKVPKLRKRSKKAGLPPGTPVHVGEKRVEKIKISYFDYDETQFQEKEVKTIEECFPFKDTPTVTWINIDGIHEVEIIEKLGNHFEIHPLILEDILNTEQRPKIDDFESYIFVVLKMLYYEENEIKIEQISLILGSNFVISFQEQPTDVFDPIRERIRNLVGRIRKQGSDYLAYTLLDTIVDNYFIILEKVGETIEFLEEELVENPTSETLHQLHKLKREMIALRKSVWPLREVISRLERLENPLIRESTDIYLRDVYDHTIQVIDAVETYRDMLSGMFDIYLSSISNKMNEVMKVLTIIATIFIPLTLIAGIYGMNFKLMPELEWQFGYPFTLLMMFALGLVMTIYFRMKKWL
ncbi:magnesium/cobalt transporter CorA [Candidatus Borrarchaeum sp.]|uniref:magnesium/cobalt transporter CorA n=1 Tax=Candidatus Borrarchaeum sp. TaxID=2846742 RepID=UPI0025801FF5|nr:magnesium/cobalt transporter CorA [Candidatus Borrarchaeum sp.]